MMTKLLIFLIVVTSSFLQGQEKMEPKLEIHFFDKTIVQDKYFLFKNDSLIFKISDDTTMINIDYVWSSDKSMTWVLYKNQGNFDFWLLNNQRDEDKFPIDQITIYFNRKKINLYGLFVFYTGLVGLKTLDCGFCYNGNDFLFKVKTNELDKLRQKTQQVFVEIKNNYR